MLMNFDDLVIGTDNEIVSLIDLFNKITGLYVTNDSSFGIYDDSYWCGTAYYYLLERTHKSLSYLLLKLPLDRLIGMYGTYHEMDYSSLFIRFNEIEMEKTILRLLCDSKRVSIPYLSKEISINVSTLNKYSKNDEFLYAASFQNVNLIQKYFAVPFSLFEKQLSS
ncbi:MAG: hypothetical protein WC366_00270 [Bacilli bacterium]|jgi:hypothetical protein